MKTKKNTSFIWITVVFSVLCLCSGLFFPSCKPAYREPDPASSFRRIYDKPDLHHYKGIDIREMEAGGYIILGQVNRNPYLLRVDKNGDYLWDTGLIAMQRYKSPSKDIFIFEQGNQTRTYSFFCLKKMDKIWVHVLLVFNETGTELVPGAPGEVLYLSIAGEEQGFYQWVDILQVSKTGANDMVTMYVLNKSGDNGVIGSVEGDFDGNASEPDTLRRSYNCYQRHPNLDPRHHFIREFDNGKGYYYHTYRDKKAGAPGNDCFEILLKTRDNEANELETSRYPITNPFIALEWHLDEAGENTLSGARIEDSIMYYLVNTPVHAIGSEKGFAALEMEEKRPVYIETTGTGGSMVTGRCCYYTSGFFFS